MAKISIELDEKGNPIVYLGGKENKQPEPKITRFEYITDKGREVVEYGEFTYSIQDDGRTLKVFKETCVFL